MASSGSGQQDGHYRGWGAAGNWHWNQNYGWGGHYNQNWGGHANDRNWDDGVAMSWEHAEQQLDQEEKMFWATETQARLRNAGPTPMEMSHLGSLPDHGFEQEHAHDGEKVLKFYAAQTSGKAAAKRLLRVLHQSDPKPPGVVFGVRTPGFSLCKHLMLACRAGQDDIENKPGVLTCRCFAKTYCMPHGCPHQSHLLHNLESFVGTTTLCGECSKCLRCEKHPSCISNTVQEIFFIALCHNTPLASRVTLATLRYCRVASRMESEQVFQSRSLQQELCTCTSAGVFGEWRHYHLS